MTRYIIFHVKQELETDVILVLRVNNNRQRLLDDVSYILHTTGAGVGLNQTRLRYNFSYGLRFSAYKLSEYDDS